jgi:hypothetical protein
VINKLITEEDLYGAVDSAFSAGLDPDEALLPHRPAHRDRRGHARHRRAREELRRDRQAVHEPGVGHRQPRWLRAQGRTRRSSGSGRTPTSCSARSTCCARHPQGQGRQLKWHDPAASIAEGIASRGDRRIGRVIERVWRDGGTFQEWGESSVSTAGTDAMAAEGLSLDWYVYRHRRRATRSCPGSTSPPVCTRTSCGATGRRARRQRHRGLPLDALLRLRRVHRLRHRARRGVADPARPAGPGHRPGSLPRRRGARHAAARAPSTRRWPRPCRPARAGLGRGVRCEAPRPHHQARQGALHEPPRSRPDVGAGGAPCRPARRHERGVHAAPAHQLRSGVAHRCRVGGRVHRHRPH